MLMLQDLNTATKQEDITLIKEIIERDKDIDDLYANIVNTTYLIDNDPFVAGQAHLAARNLERVGTMLEILQRAFIISILVNIMKNNIVSNLNNPKSNN